MADITIPPEALEAAAQAAHEQWRFNMSCEFGLEITDYQPWDDLAQERRNELISEARAACLAMLNAWPGAAVCHYTIGDDEGYEMVLPLPFPQEGE